MITSNIKGAALSGAGGLVLGSGVGYLAGLAHKKAAEKYEQSYKSRGEELGRLKEELSQAKQKLDAGKVKSLEIRINNIEALRKKAAESKLKYRRSIKTGAAIGAGAGLATFGAKKLMDHNKEVRKREINKEFENSALGKSLKASSKANDEHLLKTYDELDRGLERLGVSKDDPLRNNIPRNRKQL